MTIHLAAAVIEGAVVGREPVVSGVECEGEVLEGAELAAEVMGD